MNDRPTATITPTRWNTPRWLPLALGVAAGVLLVILGVTLLSRLTATPANSPAVAPVARQICSDLTTQQYDDLYGLLATTEPQAFDPEGLTPSIARGEGWTFGVL